MAETKQQETKAPAAKTEAKEQEQRQAQAVASTRAGAVPAPRPQPTQPDEESVDAVRSAQDKLAGLDRETLVQLASAVDAVLATKGQDAPGAAGPSIAEIAGGLPVVEDDSFDLRAAAKLADVKEHEVIGYAVRQAQLHDGRRIGAKYGSVVTLDGTKHIVQLD